MKTPLWCIAALSLAWLLCPLGAPAQGAPPASGPERLSAAARRTGLSQESLDTVLAGLSRMAAEGLPTGRFVDRMVECIAKRADAGLVRSRAERLEHETRLARTLLDGAYAQGLKAAPPWGPDDLEEVADALQSSPLEPSDLLKVAGLLKTDDLPRILAGTDSLAHLRRMGLEDGLIRKLLAASAPSLPDSELRAFPSAVFTGRRCGKSDAEIVAEVVRHLGKGRLPSQVAKEWAQSPAFRGGKPRNPDWSPGSGQGPGPGWSEGQGPRSGDGKQGGRGPGGGKRGGR